MGNIVHQSEIVITREKGPTRKALIRGFDEPVYYGVHGGIKGFYDFIVYFSHEFVEGIRNYLMEFIKRILPASTKEMDPFSNMVDLIEVVSPTSIDMEE